jgi:hypothetical protein
MAMSSSVSHADVARAPASAMAAILIEDGMNDPLEYFTFQYDWTLVRPALSSDPAAA